MGAGCSPDREQYALTLVVAGAVGVGLAEVAGGDRTVDGPHDLGEPNRVGLAGKDVAAADASLRANETGALQGEQDLFEVGLRESGALGDLPHGGRGGFGVERERQKGSGRIVTSG